MSRSIEFAERVIMVTVIGAFACVWCCVFLCFVPACFSQAFTHTRQRPPQPRIRTTSGGNRNHGAVGETSSTSSMDILNFITVDRTKATMPTSSIGLIVGRTSSTIPATSRDQRFQTQQVVDTRDPRTPPRDHRAERAIDWLSGLLGHAHWMRDVR